MQIGRGSMIFMQGRGGGGHIKLGNFGIQRG